MGVRFAQVGTQLPDFAGYLGPYTNLVSPAFNNTQGLDDSSLLYWWGFQSAAAVNTLFRSSTKAAPTVYTTHTLPIATQISASPICVANDDLILLGANNSASARVYRYVPSTTTFTLLTYPQQANQDAVFYILTHPTDPNIFFVTGINRNIAGNAGVYQLELATDTWTLIGGGGNGWTANNNGSRTEINIFQGRLIAGVGGGSVNLANVFVSSLISDGTPYTWTQIAGAGLNGSWALGTIRNCRCFGLEGTLYAGIGGGSNGDAEVWRRSPSTGQWTQIGGDGLNSSWAAGTKTNVPRLNGRGNILLAGTQGASGDAEGWQFDVNTQLWTQVAGDSLNNSWASNRIAVNICFIDNEGKLIWGGGNNSAGTSFAYLDAGAPFTPGAAGGFGELSRRRQGPFNNF